jgi:hypothetical protein
MTPTLLGNYVVDSLAVLWLCKDTQKETKMTRQVQITAEPTRTAEGKTRWHFNGPAGKSLHTWADKRTAIAAGKREWNVR